MSPSPPRRDKQWQQQEEEEGLVVEEEEGVELCPAADRPPSSHNVVFQEGETSSIHDTDYRDSRCLPLRRHYLGG